MTVAAVGSPQLTHYLRESPDLISQQMHRRQMMCTIARTVTLVALGAIIAAASFLAILGLAFTAGYLTISIGLAVATPILFYVDNIFANRAWRLQFQADVEQGTADQLRKLKTWTPLDIEHFYQEHQIAELYHAQFATASGIVKAQNMLPLIARFNFWDHLATDSLALVKIDLTESDDKLANAAEDIKRLVRERSWATLTQESLPAKLESAIILQLLVNPYQEICLDRIGRFRLDDDEKQDQRLDSQRPYFELTNHRQALTIQEVVSSSPAQLRQRIFGNDTMGL